MRSFYETSYANVHRGVYELGVRSTDAYEGARAKRLRGFVNAASAREIVFTRTSRRGSTSSPTPGGSTISVRATSCVVTEMEHHSNFVPWQYIAERTGAEFAAIPVDDQGELETGRAGRARRGRGRLKVVACMLVSNSLGTVNPVERLADMGARAGGDHGRGRRPGRSRTGRSTCRRSGCDFLGFTWHKMCGPTGIGALWGRRELLERMAPFKLGGHMIRKVDGRAHDLERDAAQVRGGHGADRRGGRASARRSTTWSDVGLESIERHERELAGYALERLAEVPGVRLFGPPADRRVGIVSFVLDGVHPHDVAQVVDSEGVAVRAGHHCNQPLMSRLGVAATTRASFYLYTLPEEIDRLVEGIHKARKLFA